jgi:hypothetical protein
MDQPENQFSISELYMKIYLKKVKNGERGLARHLQQHKGTQNKPY